MMAREFDNLRTIDLPKKDQPLREDVSLLGSMLGDVLVDQHGEQLLECVEAVRKAAILQREGQSNEGLEEMLSSLEIPQVMRVIHAFSSYLRLTNLAEKVHRIRRRRAYQRAGEQAQRGSLDAVIGELKADGADPASVRDAIVSMRILPVFTAHPTEATRRTIQEKEYDILLRLVERLNPELTPGEQQLSLRRIRSALTSSWQTRIMPHARPTVADELDNILFYITEILYRVTPRFYDSVRSAFERHYQQALDGFHPGSLLRFGSWVGGDMDGNPNVNARTIMETLARQRAVIVGRYLPDVRHLARYLSQSLSEITVSEAVMQRYEEYAQLLPGIRASIPQRHRDMPYRCLLKMVGERLQGTLAGEASGYESAQDFAADIKIVRDSLVENRGEHAGLFGVERLLTRIRTFGFHLVTLDVRQDSLVHRRVMGELLGDEDWLNHGKSQRAAILNELLQDHSLPDRDPGESLSEEALESLSVFRAIREARQTYGEAAIGLFIVSMAQGADDVLTVLALARIADPDFDEAHRLEVAPLLETVADLQAGPSILNELLSLATYREHVREMDKRQVIMVGYSDSNKDSGIVASRWALYEAQRRLVKSGQENDVRIVFFHGRGGTVSRGGGNLVNGILGAPPSSVGGYMRVTEQGEVINQKYGVRVLAQRNLELVTGATLAHTLKPDMAGLDENESAILAGMAEVSRAKFRSLVYDDAEFPGWFRKVTPLDVIERLNIGSRPASRRSRIGIENLRAIPWVFSWGQVRIGLPGVYGFGAALDDAIRTFGIEALRAIRGRHVFFEAMINDVEMVLAKSVLDIGERYASLGGPENMHYFQLISAEFDLATRRILELKELDNLLDDQRVLQRNIRLRNPYADPLHLLQIDLLKRWRAGNCEDEKLLEALKASVKGIALAIQNTG